MHLVNSSRRQKRLRNARKSTSCMGEKDEPPTQLRLIDVQVTPAIRFGAMAVKSCSRLSLIGWFVKFVSPSVSKARKQTEAVDWE
jgi:hypothetical protein